MITWKQRVTLYPVERNLNAILDIAKVADLLIPIMSTDGVDDFGDLIVSSLKAQGVPTILGALVVITFKIKIMSYIHYYFRDLMLRILNNKKMLKNIILDYLKLYFLMNLNLWLLMELKMYHNY